VLIFDFPQTYTAFIEIKLTLNGSNVGERFGAALASGDINKDGLDDLIVGAPLFTVEGGMDEGRVAIYSGNTTNAMANKPIILKGTATGGRFGTAVSFLGDLDHNKYGGNKSRQYNIYLKKIIE